MIYRPFIGNMERIYVGSRSNARIACPSTWTSVGLITMLSMPPVPPASDLMAHIITLRSWPWDWAAVNASGSLKNSWKFTAAVGSTEARVASYARSMEAWKPWS